MSLKFTSPPKVLVISDMFTDLGETEGVVKNFKLHGIQPGIFYQHSEGVYEDVVATCYDDLIESLEEKNVLISTATKPEDVKAGQSLCSAYRKLQEFGLSLSIGEGAAFNKIIVIYDPELEHLHSSDNDDYLV